MLFKDKSEVECFKNMWNKYWSNKPMVKYKVEYNVNFRIAHFS